MSATYLRSYSEDRRGDNLLARSVIVSVLLLLVTASSAPASLSLSEREEIATIATESPMIDLDIEFESRSSKIGVRSAAFVELEALGLALTNPDLKDCTFIVAGHTAFEGRGAYDQDLSERRADAVKRFLVENFDLLPEHLITVGYGSSKPKFPSDPLAPINQRVQIINVTGK